MNASTKKYLKLVGITIFLIILFFAYLDTLGLAMFATVGGYGSETHKTLELEYLNLFWTFAYGMIIAVALMFYYFRRDKSEAIGIFAGTILMLWSGLEDVIYYCMLGQPMLDASMPWLMNTPLSLTSRILGYTTVTPIGLYLQLIIGTIITYHVLKYLKNKL